MVNISRKDLERLAIGFGVADFLTEGRLSAPIARGTKAALKRAAPAIGRALITYGPRVAITAARVTPTPLAAAAVGAAAIQNRARIADAAGNVYEMVAPAAQQYAAGVAERVMDPETYSPIGPSPQTMQLERLGIVPSRPKKVRSKFNAAVKKGMEILKGSTHYGKRGNINNAKKAFTAVTKAASRVNRGLKAPAKGISRKLHTAMSKILPKKKKQTKRKSKIDITVYKK